MKKIIPNTKITDKTVNNIFKYSQELQKKILSIKTIEFSEDTKSELEFSTFLYDLSIYKDVMKLKYSKFVVETTINTIFIQLENYYKNLGNNLSKDFFKTVFNKLDYSLRKIYNLANSSGEDGLLLIAMYFCDDELKMNEEEINIHSDIVEILRKHFYKIINLNLEEI